ncbi:melanocyte-stimulating hormone receptor-like [Orbicella faveolata]|uniref:melanocyte-stimulating hormone receptor-like n=1 Tax=Orbicella faveolata TaxID=48498 RepID=UPI0009E41CB1|nr:melanocyte-stimulating hormone receptor-like [Orbicella faveolata]XP_020625169.1 melanocyte-stimulating hormone receptor-like [Orbicella faveolata]
MNFTGEGQQTQTVLQIRCSAAWASGIHEHLKHLSAFHAFLSITAVLGNILILVALRKVSSLHPPTKLLFRCLATTDLCVGLVAEPLSAVYWMSVAHEEWNLCRYAAPSFIIASYTLCSVSLLTVTAISVDRLLALLLGLRFRQVVTLKRTYVTVVIFWIMAAVSSILYLLTRLITIWFGYLLVPCCVVTSIASYTKIFLKLRHQEGQVQQEQTSHINPLNIERYRKAVSGVLWVQCTLVAFYLPYGIVVALFDYTAKFSPSSVLILELAVSLVFVNSSLNPFLYCWKISEVKQAVKETIREALCCLSG